MGLRLTLRLRWRNLSHSWWAIDGPAGLRVQYDVCRREGEPRYYAALGRWRSPLHVRREDAMLAAETFVGLHRRGVLARRRRDHVGFGEIARRELVEAMPLLCLAYGIDLSTGRDDKRPLGRPAAHGLGRR